MRIFHLLAPLALAVSACTYYGKTDDAYDASGQQNGACGVASDGDGSGTEDLTPPAPPPPPAAANAVNAANATNEDGPPPAHAPREEGTFEVVARLVLQSIPYKDCGAGGPGDVDVSFIPSGAVQKVVVYADQWQDAAKECVAERFALAHVAPFGGDVRTVRWRVALDAAPASGGGGGWGA